MTNEDALAMAGEASRAADRMHPRNRAEALRELQNRVDRDPELQRAFARVGLLLLEARQHIKH